MIDLKNRSPDTLTIQFDRSVSAGPVRPQTLEVPRGTHNKKTGEVILVKKSVTLGGVLTLPPRSVTKAVPEVLLEHPVLQGLIRAGVVKVLKPRQPVASPAPAAQSVPPPIPSTFTRRRGR